MEAPFISKKQAKKSLASKKKKKIETIKNTLAQPYQSYWPLLTPEDNNHLNTALTRLLPRLKNDKVNVPYKEIKGIPKDERKKFRESFTSQSPVETEKALRSNLVFGVNNVTKLLEARQAACILVASDVAPRLFVQHVLDQSVLYNVPIVVVEGLRETLRKSCGISGAVMAVSSPAPVSSNLEHIRQEVAALSQNYPLPENHIHFNRRADISTIIISDSEGEKSNIVIGDAEEEEKKPKNYHLKKGPKGKRAFVPEVAEKCHAMEFISLSSTPINTSKKPKVTYRPLTVKRLKGDKNRIKRKLDKVKKKKNTQ